MREIGGLALQWECRSMKSRRGGGSRRCLGRTLIVLLALSLPLAPVWAAEAAPPDAAAAGTPAAAPRPAGVLTDSQKQGYGCLIGASTVMALAGLAGATEVMQIYTGGEVAPASSLLLWVTLFVGVAATACSAASAATPAILHAWGYFSGVIESATDRAPVAAK